MSWNMFSARMQPTDQLKYLPMKRPVFEASEFQATRKLAEDYDVRTVDTICERRNWMAGGQATGIWHVRF